MILSVCLNPCLDKTYSLPAFALDAPNRVTPERTDLGGKGVNVARVVCTLGGDGHLVGFDDGSHQVARAMEKEQVPARLIALPGDLRVNLKIQDQAAGRTIEINEQGPRVSAEQMESMLQAVLEEAQPGCWVTLSGSLPAGVSPDCYARMCRVLKEKGCRVAADCDGEALRRVLEEEPDLIKPNAQEFFALTGTDPGDERRAAEACRQLIGKGVSRVCLSRGAEGAMIVTGQGAWRCDAAPVRARAVQGAGDTMLAALLLALEREWPAGEALRFATAAAGASVMRPGSLLCRAEDVRALLDQLPAARRCS